ncbi:hypothetical protein [Faecalibacter sp. LW9]|uniref:hypothetical protein n=1 Tax=Faecalibacter sp. LW9 TaxID=3103144 RepID=UPI002AFFBF54|nr:hypothetical protein [Faecalibacter sp. LW9]
MNKLSIILDEQELFEKISKKLFEIYYLYNDLEIKLKFIKKCSDISNEGFFTDDPFLRDYDYFYKELIVLSVIKLCFLSEEKDRKHKNENLSLSILFNDLGKYLNLYDDPILNKIDLKLLKSMNKNLILKEKISNLRDYRNNIYAHSNFQFNPIADVKIADLIFTLEYYVNMLDILFKSINYNNKNKFAYNAENSKLFEIFLNNSKYSK